MHLRSWVRRRFARLERRLGIENGKWSLIKSASPTQRLDIWVDISVIRHGRSPSVDSLDPAAIAADAGADESGRDDHDEMTSEAP